MAAQAPLAQVVRLEFDQPLLDRPAHDARPQRSGIQLGEERDDVQAQGHVWSGSGAASGGVSTGRAAGRPSREERRPRGRRARSGPEVERVGIHDDAPVTRRELDDDRADERHQDLAARAAGDHQDLAAAGAEDVGGGAQDLPVGGRHGGARQLVPVDGPVGQGGGIALGLQVAADQAFDGLAARQAGEAHEETGLVGLAPHDRQAACLALQEQDAARGETRLVIGQDLDPDGAPQAVHPPDAADREPGHAG